jgi:hypothetical protein
MDIYIYMVWDLWTKYEFNLLRRTKKKLDTFVSMNEF